MSTTRIATPICNPVLSVSTKIEPMLFASCLDTQKLEPTIKSPIIPKKNVNVHNFPNFDTARIEKRQFNRRDEERIISKNLVKNKAALQA